MANVAAEPVSPRYNFAKADWEHFATLVNSSIPDNPDVLNAADVDLSVQLLSESIKSSVDSAVPKVEHKSFLIQLPGDILDLIKTRNRLRSRLQNRYCPLIKREVNALRRTIKDKITDFRSERWKLKVSNLNSHDNSVWRVTKSLTRAFVNIPPLVTNNGTAFSAEEKANCLADSLQETFRPHQNPSDARHTRQTRDKVIEFLARDYDPDYRKTSVPEIKWIIKHLRNRKAPGIDKITNVILKHLPDETIAYISFLLNKCLELNHFPAPWKLAGVIVFQKPGKDGRLPTSYRPISLLCSLSKIFEKIILKRLNAFLKRNGILRNEQFGFRSSHSTQHQLVRLTEYITHGFNFNMSTGAVLLDVEKAFDSVWHAGLLSKLIDLRVPPRLIHLLGSYLSRRSFRVNVYNRNSTVRPILAGVPQGSLLGPVLFNIYINDIPSPPRAQIGIYADDTIIYAKSHEVWVLERNIQEALSLIERWCALWRVKINVAKTEAILFTRRYKTHFPSRTVTLFGEILDWKLEVKYLGVTLDRKLLWRSHIENTRGKACGALRRLIPVVNRDSSLNIKTGLLIYKSLIRPVLTYAPAVWGNAAPTHLYKLQIVQNKVLRIICNAPRYTRNKTLHDDLQLESLESYCKGLAGRFFDKFGSHENELIVELDEYDHDPGIKYKRPRHFLFL